MAKRSFWISFLSATLGILATFTAMPREDATFITALTMWLILMGLFVGPMFAWRAGFIKGALLKEQWIRPDYEVIEKAEESYARKRLHLLAEVATLEKVRRTDV